MLRLLDWFEVIDSRRYISLLEKGEHRE